MKKCTVHALIVGGGRGGCHGCQIKKTITVSKRVNEEQILRLDFFLIMYGNHPTNMVELWEHCRKSKRK